MNNSLCTPKTSILHLKGKSGTKSKSKKISRSTKSHFYTTMKQYFKKHYPHYPWLICQLIFKGIDLVSIIKK